MARTAPRSAAALLLLLPVLAGCSVGVPDPAAPRPAGSAAATLATPTVTPGYDAEAVAARNLPFTAGDRLVAGVPVRLSDGLGDAPRWKPGRQDVAGASEYRKADGCLVAAKVRVNQWPLVVAGDDKARKAFIAAAIAAVQNCTPLSFSPALAQGIGGNVFTLQLASPKQQLSPPAPQTQSLNGSGAGPRHAVPGPVSRKHSRSRPIPGSVRPDSTQATGFPRD